MTTTATSSKPVTADDLLAMGDIGRCELIYGELVMMSPAGAEHGVVALRFGSFLREFVEANDLGYVFAAETGFMITRGPDLLRAADASFVRKARIPGAIPSGYIDGVPDLAVEVVSPRDTKREVAEKVDMWLANGCAVVWIADPKPQTVTLRRVGQKPTMLTVGEEIRDEPLLPGFVLPLAKVFKLP